VLAGGCLLGILGCVVAAGGCAFDTWLLVIPGFALVGMSQATILLSRAAAADLYPPERRARGISYVLFGALFGAALGPLVFRPLLAGEDLSTDALVVPYLAAGAIMVVGFALVVSIRPDPKTIAEQWHGTAAPVGPAAPLAQILRRPGVLRALVGAVVSFAVMAAVMNLSGYIVVGHDHQQAAVFDVISAHIVGMYALVLVIGRLIDRLGRRPSIVGGLVIMAASCLGLAWFTSVLWMSVALFGLGLGWNHSYVAAAADLSDAVTPAERGKLIGFSDRLSAAVAVALVLAGGVTYTELGVGSLAAAATVIAFVPALWLLSGHRRTPVAAPDLELAPE
jgi:MFS family permease